MQNKRISFTLFMYLFSIMTSIYTEKKVVIHIVCSFQAESLSMFNNIHHELIESIRNRNTNLQHYFHFFWFLLFNIMLRCISILEERKQEIHLTNHQHPIHRSSLLMYLIHTYRTLLRLVHHISISLISLHRLMNL